MDAPADRTGTTDAAGLTDAEAAHRLAEEGPNALPHRPEPSLALRAARQAVEPL